LICGKGLARNRITLTAAPLMSDEGVQRSHWIGAAARRVTPAVTPAPAGQATAGRADHRVPKYPHQGYHDTRSRRCDSCDT